MPELVNATAKSQLDPTRNQEPTHLGGASYETLGGPGVTSEPNGADYKIDAAKGVGTDTTIPKSVPAEPTHLKGVSEDDEEPEVSFDDDDAVMESDDIDSELDKFNEADVDVDLQQEDDEEDTDKKDMSEDDDSEDDKKSMDEDDESEDDKKDVTEADEDEDEKKLEEDDDSEDEKKSMDEDDADGDGDDDKKGITESRLRLKIKVPAVKLNESVIPAKNQKKVAVLFEQAIKSTTKQVTGQVHKHYKALYEQKVAKLEAQMAKKVDGYLSYVVEEWVKQNRVQIRTSLRTQLAEEFLSGLQKLMKEHYIDVPESKVNVVKKLQTQVTGLTKRLNEQVAKTMKVRKLAEEANKLRIVAQFTRGMSEAQAAKVQKLAESVKYTNSKDFKDKLSVLKESYFPASKGEKKDRKVTTLAEETVVVPQTDKKNENATADPLVASVVNTLKEQANRAKW